ncbi:acyl-CoA--6-aminopenicillanic acid acyl-transferase [Raoultella ornithinolytica]|nr:acyl-CoA--6-aminopenicillanic acid acyl-transferase [Raoultella ornithinolytica]ELN4409206.1 acyl-CoA--6-aminopenicillanic acid acyl-transferase [Raoultella ornithinolytica]
MKKITISGSSFAVGQRLGEFGRDAWHQKLVHIPLWQTVIGMKDSAQTRAMRTLVEQQFPLIWQELTGMAAGLQAPVDEVFAWNCRGDLVRSTSDGCTTVVGESREGERVIAHNEDGFPQLRDDCAWVSISPTEGMAFSSFAYPGSLCGHTFAVNAMGIVNTVNNIRALHRPVGIPRQILARAALNASTLDEAIAVLTTLPRSGAFHHTLGQSGDSRLFSIEATGAGHSVRLLDGTFGHANHLIHESLRDVQQVITDSSASRQARLIDELTTSSQLDATGALAILSDQQVAALPIYRLSPQDPDEENTLATALFVLNARQVEWRIFTQDRQQAILQGAVNA